LKESAEARQAFDRVPQRWSEPVSGGPLLWPLAEQSVNTAASGKIYPGWVPTYSVTPKGGPCFPAQNSPRPPRQRNRNDVLV